MSLIFYLFCFDLKSIHNYEILSIQQLINVCRLPLSIDIVICRPLQHCTKKLIFGTDSKSGRQSKPSKSSELVSMPLVNSCTGGLWSITQFQVNINLCLGCIQLIYGPNSIKSFEGRQEESETCQDDLDHNPCIIYFLKIYHCNCCLFKQPHPQCLSHQLLP